VLQFVAVRCSVTKYGNDTLNFGSQDQNQKKEIWPCVAVFGIESQCVAERCSVLQCDNDPLHLVSQHQKKGKSETGPRLV